MIYIRPQSPTQFAAHNPCAGANNACHRPAGVHKVYFKACNSDEKKTDTQPQTQDKPKETPKPRSEEAQGQVFVERAPIHFEENDERAKLAMDVAGFSPEDVQVKMEDFVVSIDGKRTNKLGDTYVIRRRFKVDRKTVEEDVHASLTDGVLEILVPKKAKVGARSIPISTQPVVELAKEESSEHAEESEHEDTAAEATEDAAEVETVDEDKDEEEPGSHTTESSTEKNSWEDVKEE